jgi:hypothetical protein
MGTWKLLHKIIILKNKTQYSGNGKDNLSYTYTHPDVKQRVLLEYFILLKGKRRRRL